MPNVGFGSWVPAALRLLPTWLNAPVLLVIASAAAGDTFREFPATFLATSHLSAEQVEGKGAGRVRSAP